MGEACARGQHRGCTRMSPAPSAAAVVSRVPLTLSAGSRPLSLRDIHCGDQGRDDQRLPGALTKCDQKK